MKKYLVTVHEVWTQQYRIEAADEAEARHLVGELAGEELEDRHEFTHVLDSDLWEVEEEGNENICL